jgi:hypothetical protein
VVFPCGQDGHVLNLYGRSLGAAFPHRFLPAPRAACSPGNRFASSSP